MNRALGSVLEDSSYYRVLCAGVCVVLGIRRATDEWILETSVAGRTCGRAPGLVWWALDDDSHLFSSHSGRP